MRCRAGRTVGAREAHDLRYRSNLGERVADPRSTPWKASYLKAGGEPLTSGAVFVGIDLSLAKTACVALSADGSCYWRLHQPKGSEMSAAARLAMHQQLLYDFFNTINTPTLICMEGYSFGSRGSAVFQIAEWGGVARLTLYLMGLEEITVIMAPCTLKKFVTSNGNAKKNTMLREVFRLWGFDAEDDNVADAYGLAQAAMTIHTGEARYAWQRDALRRMGPPSGAASEH